MASPVQGSNFQAHWIVGPDGVRRLASTPEKEQRILKLNALSQRVHEARKQEQIARDEAFAKRVQDGRWDCRNRTQTQLFDPNAFANGNQDPYDHRFHGYFGSS